MADLSISRLKSSIGGELLRPNRFELSFQPPQTVQLAMIEQGLDIFSFDDKMTVLAERGEMPGRTFATTDTNRPGPQFKSVYDATYNDITFSIIADEKLETRRGLEIWMDYIFRPANTSQNSGGITRFHDDYVGYVIASQLNSQGLPVARYKLHNAYPIQISSMPFSAEENDTYQRYTVDFTYRFHTAEFGLNTL